MKCTPSCTIDHDVTTFESCSPWTGEPEAYHAICVTPGNRVLVYDPISLTYTSCHQLSADAIACILRRLGRRPCDD